MKKRTIALLMATVMIFGVAVGGTIAWLTATTDVVQNTFTVGDIDINLDEARVEDGILLKEVKDENDIDGDGDKEEMIDVEANDLADADRINTNTYKLIPGTEYAKDPTVTVYKGSEKCYLFVKVDVQNNTIQREGTAIDIIQYELNVEGWTLVNGTENVYVRVVDVLNAEKDFTWIMLKDGDKDEKHITINETLTKAELEAIDALNDASKPQLKFTAYAVQYENMTDAAEAWAVATTGSKTSSN